MINKFIAYQGAIDIKGLSVCRCIVFPWHDFFITSPEFPKSLWKLVSNPALMLLGLSEVCCMYYVIGVLINQPRYLEVHFGQPAFVANIATGKSIK